MRRWNCGAKQRDSGSATLGWLPQPRHSRCAHQAESAVAGRHRDTLAVRRDAEGFGHSLVAELDEWPPRCRRVLAGLVVLYVDAGVLRVPPVERDAAVRQPPAASVRDFE